MNHRHVTEEKLNEAITTVVNGYSQCELTKVWGLVNQHPGMAQNGTYHRKI